MFFKYIDENKYFPQNNTMTLIKNQIDAMSLMKIFIFIDEFEKHQK
jgi:adenylate kinase family enzyme